MNIKILLLLLCLDDIVILISSFIINLFTIKKFLPTKIGIGQVFRSLVMY